MRARTTFRGCPGKKSSGTGRTTGSSGSGSNKGDTSQAIATGNHDSLQLQVECPEFQEPGTEMVDQDGEVGGKDRIIEPEGRPAASVALKGSESPEETARTRSVMRNEVTVSRSRIQADDGTARTLRVGLVRS